MLRALRTIILGVLLFPAALHAQSWPTRPVTMVVPFAAGGPMDTVGRILAPRLGELLGQQVVIENVGGAGGMTGSARVAKAAPDGYQFVLGNVGTHAVSQTLSKNPLYNAVTDFAPVALVADLSLVLVARKELPAGNLPEFIAYVKANQAKLQFAFGGRGLGDASRLRADQRGDRGQCHAHPVSRRRPAMQDLVAGRVDYMCVDTPVAVPQIESGTIKAIAILTRARSPNLPALASAHEQGLADFEASNWAAVFLPKGTPAPIIQKLHDAIVEAANTPAVQKRLKDNGVDLVAPERRSPDYLATFVASEIAKWAGPIKASGVTSD